MPFSRNHQCIKQSFEKPCFEVNAVAKRLCESKHECIFSTFHAKKIYCTTQCMCPTKKQYIFSIANLLHTYLLLTCSLRIKTTYVHFQDRHSLGSGFSGSSGTAAASATTPTSTAGSAAPSTSPRCGHL